MPLKTNGTAMTTYESATVQTPSSVGLGRNGIARCVRIDATTDTAKSSDWDARSAGARSAVNRAGRR
jgi:hypothetical protein